MDEKFFETLRNLSIGFIGENKVRNYLKSKKLKFFQADVICEYQDYYCLIEIKRQEMFMAPPFDGHGLPLWQIESRLKFYELTKIIPFLFVVCLTSDKIYYNSFIELEKGEKHDTRGERPRRIYNINNFKILKDDSKIP